MDMLVGTTVGYLLGESKDMNVHKDPQLLIRLNAFSELPEEK